MNTVRCLIPLLQQLHICSVWMFQYEKQENEICENILCASARIKQGLRYGFKQWKIPNLFENVDFLDQLGFYVVT